MPIRNATPGCSKLCLVALALCSALSARCNPAGMTVVSGNATAAASGPVLSVTAANNTLLNWQSFNIAAGETTRFQQPSSRSVVWNQIADQNPSQIWGNLQANGIVVLMNQNGFYMGPNASINVGGFIAASAAVLPPPGAPGGFWSYQGPPPTAHIINYGQIHAQTGGSVFLIAEGIENHGVISAPEGNIGLFAGKKVMISDRPDGRGLSATVDLPQGAVDNTGRLIADAGTLALRAQVVNQNGLVQANSVRVQQGTIELLASDAINLGPNSVIQANGDPNIVSRGGQITIKSGQTFADDPASRIEARGGGFGGNGGAVEISAASMDGVESQLDGTAQPGWTGGRLLLDPYNIVLGTTGRTTPSGTIHSGDSPATGTLALNVNRAFTGFSQILLQATHDISLADNTVWDLNQSTGINAAGSVLTLEAGNNINFGRNSRIVSDSGWSVNLSAGVDFQSPTLAVRSGIGGIYLDGGPSNPGYSGAIETAEGDITLNAGHEIMLAGGYIRTVNGGNISLTTGDGSVDAGNKPDTYDFTSTGYAISALGLGGIGTAHGGNVQIHSGQDILGLNAHVGAFGYEPGNVTLEAARDIKGSFMLANGTGLVNAGEDIGTSGTGASFGLVKGGWTLNAARDLFLNEIYNPDGSLNNNRSVFGARVTFPFDYALNAYATLNAGDAVVVTGDNIIHTADNPDRPAIYPPLLSIAAGHGGVTLDRDVILYPSAEGGLNIQTTGGGSLSSSSDHFSQLIISDSDSPVYTTFAAGHAATPLHLGNTGPGINLDISGDVQNLFLRSPEAAKIHVHGNALNFAFEGQNVSANDVTRLQIDGDYFSRSDRTFVTVSDLPNLALLTDPILSLDPDLGARLSYDLATHQLGLQGIMTAADKSFLLHPTTYVLDPRTGEPALDNQGNPLIVNATFTGDTAALQKLFTDSQDIPASPLARTGLQLGGPGSFVVDAHNMNLGISGGIRSVGPLLNPALAQVSLRGANIDLELSGDLEMTSSQIASFNGGNITVNSLGSLAVGSQDSFTSDDTPKGIYTAHGGNVSVHATGNINLDGSRIATYDGGNILIASNTGNVDAGSGGRGYFSVTTSQVDPLTGLVENRNDRFFGSGIVALTRTDSSSRVGNIEVRAGGDILANSGGIIQLAFNTVNQSGAEVLLNAGGNILASQSGILGYNVGLTAGRSITGLILAAQNLNLNAQQNIFVTAMAGGQANFSAGGSLGGPIMARGIDASASEITGTLISTSGGTSTSGNASGATIGAFTGVAAPAAQKMADLADKTVAGQSLALNDDSDEKRRLGGQSPVLTRRVGRVTVILPPNN